MTTKAEVRRSLLSQREALSTETKELWDRLIFQRAHKARAFQVASAVHVYRSTAHEIETWPFIEYAWALRIPVFVPRICGPIDDGQMEHVLVSRTTEWTRNSLGIEEPKTTPTDIVRQHHDFGAQDAIIVPIVAFHADGRRIGYGKGFYDRFLAATPAHTIGLAYEFQRISDLPTSSHDVQLQRIATNERWYECIR